LAAFHNFLGNKSKRIFCRRIQIRRHSKIFPGDRKQQSRNVEGDSMVYVFDHILMNEEKWGKRR
jgi:hypothetical protein